MSTATLNGFTVLRGRINIPAYGVWWADIEIDQPEDLSGQVSIVFADQTFVGTVMSGGPWQSRARYRIAAGAGQWGKTIPAKAYANDAGVKPAKVIADAAAACGESVGSIAGNSVGSAYVRSVGPASRVLDDIRPEDWYVDFAGVTQFGRRAAITYAGGAVRLKTDLAQGTIELAPELVADLVPGSVVDGLEAVDIEHSLDGGKVRTTVWGRGIAETTRLTTAFGRLIDSFTGHHKYFAPWDYRVVQVSGERFDLQTVRVSTGMPDLRLVPIRPGVSGCKAHPKLGSLVLVGFVNGDPARPIATSFDDADSPGFIPSELSLQAGTTGTDPTEHATSAESLILALQAQLTIIATAAGLTGVTPLTGAGLASLLNALLTDAAGAAMVASCTGTLGSLTHAAIEALLAAKAADATGRNPRLGWPKVMGG